MALVSVIIDFALLPCSLIASAYYCYTEEMQLSLQYLLVWVVIFYLQQTKQGNSLIIQKINQFQIEQSQRRIKKIVREVSSLAEQFNEATKLRTDMQVKQTLLGKQLCTVDDNLKQLQKEYTSLDSSVRKIQNTMMMYQN